MVLELFDFVACPAYFLTAWSVSVALKGKDNILRWGVTFILLADGLEALRKAFM